VIRGSIECSPYELPDGTLVPVRIDYYLDWDLGMNLNDYAKQAREDMAKWWHNIETGELIERNKGELLMLMVSELAEAMEGERKNLMDDKLPHRKMVEVELADALIRIFEYAGNYGYDLEGAYQEKRAFNRTREDHKHEARLRADGKKW
jgi:NTP pyrophosphatase (non-canonical NTP hydrolase)